MDDKNVCTDDVCVNGEVMHSDNDFVSSKLTVCPSDKNENGLSYDYPDSGYDYCQNGNLIIHACTPEIRKITVQNVVLRSSGHSGSQNELVKIQSLKNETEPEPEPEPEEIPEFTGFGVIAVGAAILLFLKRK